MRSRWRRRTDGTACRWPGRHAACTTRPAARTPRAVLRWWRRHRPRPPMRSGSPCSRCGRPGGRPPPLRAEPSARLARPPLRSGREVTPARPGPSVCERGARALRAPARSGAFRRLKGSGFESSPQAPPRRPSPPCGRAHGPAAPGQGRARPRGHVPCILRCPIRAPLSDLALGRRGSGPSALT